MDSTLDMKLTEMPKSNLRGLIAPLIALVAISLSILISPEFSWFENALSDLGHYTRTDLGNFQLVSAIIFNSGLIITGLLELSYVVPLIKKQNDLVNRLGLSVFGISALFLVLIGIFSENFSPTHFLVSVGFFATFPFAMWIVGVGMLRYRNLWWFAIISVLLPFVSLYVWWGTYAGMMPWSGVALPEIITAMSAIGWIWIINWLEFRNGLQPGNAGKESFD